MQPQHRFVGHAQQKPAGRFVIHGGRERSVRPLTSSYFRKTLEVGLNQIGSGSDPDPDPLVSHFFCSDRPERLGDIILTVLGWEIGINPHDGSPKLNSLASAASTPI